MFKSQTKELLNPKEQKIVMWIAEMQLRYIDEHGQTTNYKLLSELIEDQFGERIWYRNSLPFYLGFFVPICRGLGIPCLSATVVRKDTGLPGRGFAPWYKEWHPEVRSTENKVLSRTLRDEALRSNMWQVLLDHLNIDYRFGGK